MAGDRDQEIKILELKQEAKNVARDLSSAYLERNKINEEIQQLKLSLENEKQSLENIKAKNEIELTRVEKERSVLQDEKQQHDNKLSEINAEIKKQKKELNKLNGWVLNAQDEEKKYKLILEKNEKRAQEQQPFLDSVLRLENEIKELEREKDLKKLEFELLVRKGNDDLSSLKTDLIKVTEEIEHLRLEAEYAQNKKKKIDDEYTLKTEDLQKYEERVREVWNQVFPNRNMPMLS